MSFDLSSFGLYSAASFAAGVLVGTFVGRAAVARRQKRHEKPKLTYFNGRGLGEITRLIFAEAGQEYDDIRLEEIDALKKQGVLAFGQVPLLEWGKFRLVQSGAINQYLGRHFGLAGSNEEEGALCTMIHDGVVDVRRKAYEVSTSPDDKKAEAKAAFEKDFLPLWVGYFDELLKKNNGGLGFFVGDKLTYADLCVYNFFSNAIKDYPTCLDKSPLLMSFLARVAGRPRIAKWLRDRPQSDW